MVQLDSFSLRLSSIVWSTSKAQNAAGSLSLSTRRAGLRATTRSSWLTLSAASTQIWPSISTAAMSSSPTQATLWHWHRRTSRIFDSTLLRSFKIPLTRLFWRLPRLRDAHVLQVCSAPSAFDQLQNSSCYRNFFWERDNPRMKRVWLEEIKIALTRSVTWNFWRSTPHATV